MGKIITKLTDNLIIFRPDEEETDPVDDSLFYVYDEHLNKLKEYISEDYLEEMGEDLIFINDLYKNVMKKTANKVTPIIRKKKSNVLRYESFGFLLLIKLSMDIIGSHIYTKGFMKLMNEFIKSEGLIAYKLGQYFLNELKYKNRFEKETLDVLNDDQQFTKLYGLLLYNLERENDIIRAYYNFLKESTAIFIKN